MTYRMHTLRLGAAAGAVLLALSACGTTGEKATSPAPKPPVSDSGGAAEKGAPSDQGGGSSASDAGGATGENSGQGFQALFAREAKVDAKATSIAQEDLTTLLEETYTADGQSANVTCEGDLALAAGKSTTCNITLKGQKPTVWTAHPTWGPAKDGKATHGVLFLSGAEPSGKALEAIGPSHQLVAAGKGSMYGVEGPITAEHVGPDVLDSLKVNDMATFSEITCKDDLNYTSFEPVACSAKKAGGGTVTVQVLPFPDQGNENGLMVAVPTDRAQAS